MNKELDEFAEKAIPILKENGYLKDRTLLYIIIALLIGAPLGGAVIYGIENDAFKSIINQSVELEPEINVSPYFDFKPENNFTIINDITIYCNGTIT